MSFAFSRQTFFSFFLHPGQGALSQSQVLASRRSQRKNCGICVTWLHMIGWGRAALPSALAILSGHNDRLSRAAAASLLGAMAPKVDAIESWHGEGLAGEMCRKGPETGGHKERIESKMKMGHKIASSAKEQCEIFLLLRRFQTPGKPAGEPCFNGPNSCFGSSGPVGLIWAVKWSVCCTAVGALSTSWISFHSLRRWTPDSSSVWRRTMEGGIESDWRSGRSGVNWVNSSVPKV